MEVSPDGNTALSIGTDHLLKIWDLASSNEVQSIRGHRSHSNMAKILPGGKRAVTVSGDQTLRLWNLVAGTQLAAFTADAGIHCLAFNSDGRTFLAGDNGGRVHFLKLEE